MVDGPGFSRVTIAGGELPLCPAPTAIRLAVDSRIASLTGGMSWLREHEANLCGMRLVAAPIYPLHPDNGIIQR